MTVIRFGSSVISNAALENVNELNLGDGNMELTGANHHIENRNLYAFIDTVANSGAAAINNQFQSAAMAGAEFAQKLADMGHGGRVTDIANENTNDIVRITAHGLTGNNTLGSLTNGGIGWNGDAGGFGVDNAPESGARWINTGDSLDFAVTDWRGVEQAIRSFSFTVNVNPGSTGRDMTDVVIDFDGDVMVALTEGRQLVGNMATRTALDGFVLSNVAHGATVTLDFDAKTVTAGGVTTAMSAEMYAAFAKSGLDNVTVGAQRTDNLGFSITNLTIDTVDSFTGIATAGLDTLSLSWLNATGGAPNNNSAFLWTTLTGEEGTTNTLLASRSSGGAITDTASGPSDTVQGRIVLDNADLKMTAFGEYRVALEPGFPHMVGEFFGAWNGADQGIAVDTANGGANPVDGSLLVNRNLGGPGPGHIENGEFIRFDLMGGREAAQAVFAVNVIGDSNTTNENDVVVRLFQGGDLIETLFFAFGAEDAAITVADNLGQAFDRVEIGANAGSGFQMRIADADFFLI